MPQNFSLNHIEVRPAERALLIDGKRAELGSRAFDVLQALVTHRERVMTKDELLDMVWPGLVVEENNLQSQVSTLRKLLGPKSIATIPGRGYQFVLPATVAPEIPTGATPEMAQERAQEHSQDRRAPPADVAVADSTKIQGLSIVVLPFINLTGDANQEYLADGLTASMTADLARIREATIVDARTAFSYKNKTVTAQQVGRELGVRFVLHGGVQRSGSTIRINAQLANAATNAQLWSESFEGDQSNLFALFDQVTGRLGKSIDEQTIIVAARESEKRISNPKATDMIIRAQAEMIKPISLKNCQQKDIFVRQALALEPDNARAKLGVAMSTYMLVGNFSSLFDEPTRQKLLDETRDLILEVKQIDPDDFRIYCILGWLGIETDDFDAARLAFEKEVSLQPRDSTAICALANFHFYAGEPERTIELANRAMTMGDAGKYNSDWYVRYLLGCAHFMLGDYDGAILWCKKSIAEHAICAAPRAYLALAYAKKGDDAKAAAAVAEMLKLPAGDQLDRQFECPKPIQTAAYRDWHKKHFLPTAKKVGLWEKGN